MAHNNGYAGSTNKTLMPHPGKLVWIFSDANLHRRDAFDCNKCFFSG